MTAGELAARLFVKLEGDGAREIRRAAPLEEAGEEDLSFAAAEKVFELARNSAACLIVPPAYPETSQTVMRHEAPRRLFAQALAFLYPDAGAPTGVHVTASIDPAARIGEGVRIGAGCAVARNVSIGEGSVLYPNVTIYENVQIGKNVILHAGCVIGADGFGFALDANRRYVKFPQVGTVEIGDDVEIGANTCVDRAALGVTRIGEGTKLDNMVHIGHNCRIGRHVVIAAQTGLSGGVTVGDYAVLGGQIGIGDKARIEAGAVLGSGCGVLPSKIVRAGEPVWGTPARPLRRYLEQLAMVARLAAKRPG